jgi:Holliday junction resolvase RusA-like endonuclease
MADTFIFVVDGEPIAQPRHRAGKNPRTGETQMYLPKKHPIHGYRDAVAIAARLAKPAGWNPAATMSLEVEFFLSNPQGGPIKFHTGRIDASNLAKGLEDAMTAAGIWLDDSQVAFLSVKKFWCGSGQKPHTRVKVGDLSMHAVIPF